MGSGLPDYFLVRFFYDERAFSDKFPTLFYKIKNILGYFGVTQLKTHEPCIYCFDEAGLTALNDSLLHDCVFHISIDYSEKHGRNDISLEDYVEMDIERKIGSYSHLTIAMGSHNNTKNELIRSNLLKWVSDLFESTSCLYCLVTHHSFSDEPVKNDYILLDDLLVTNVRALGITKEVSSDFNATSFGAEWQQNILWLQSEKTANGQASLLSLSNVFYQNLKQLADNSIFVKREYRPIFFDQAPLFSNGFPRVIGTNETILFEHIDSDKELIVINIHFGQLLQGIDRNALQSRLHYWLIEVNENLPFQRRIINTTTISLNSSVCRFSFDSRGKDVELIKKYISLVLNGFSVAIKKVVIGIEMICNDV